MPNPCLPLEMRSDLLFAPRKQLQRIAKMSRQKRRDFSLSVENAAYWAERS